MERTNIIIPGDCIAGMAAMEADSVDLAFADPPFNIGYHYDIYDDRKSADQYLNWSRQWIEGVIRVLKPSGTFWLAIGDEFAAELKVLCTRDLNLHCRSWVIWFYTFGVNCKNKFTRSHAHLFHFVKDPVNFTFNAPAVRVPSARELVYGDKRADPKGRLPDDTWMIPPALPEDVTTRDGFVLRPQDIPDSFAPDTDTWYYSRVAGTFAERRGWHGCQMPEQLLGRIIRACSNEGDLVLDPFGGSGTTLAVAKKLNRQFLGFELSKKYAKNIEKRLAAITHGTSLIGPADALTSAPKTIAGRVLERKGLAPRSEVVFAKSPVVTRLNVTLGQVASSLGELNTAIVEAYLATSNGYAIDRAIADPSLNNSFIKACQELKLPLSPLECNRRLLRLRKSGKLSGLPKPHGSNRKWDELEPFAFASEIAWQILSDRGHSLDDILCDPQLALEFDKTASRFEPGYTPFDYRWAAFTIRKKAKDRRQLGMHSRVPAEVHEMLRKHRILDPQKIVAESGLYLIKREDCPLYLGDTTNLRTRIESHINSLDAFGLALGWPRTVKKEISILSIPFSGDQEKRWGVHSRLLGSLNPKFNEKKQAFVPIYKTN